MKKILMLMVIVALILVGCSQTNQKSDSSYPEKTIELIVPFAAGGGTDTVARTIMSTVNKYIPNGQSVVVANKPGGAATIGTTEVVTAEPDGYKILITTLAPISIQPHYGNTTYSYDDLEPVLRVTSVPQVLVVKSDAPWQTFDQWFEYVHSNPDQFSYAIAGTGNPAHIAMEALNAAANIKTKVVPFEGGAPAVTALLGGHVDGAVVQPLDVRAQLDSGDLKILVNMGSTKDESIIDIPTLREKGIDVAVDIDTGVFVPKNTPLEVQKIIHDAFKQALEDSAAKEMFAKLNMEPAYADAEVFKGLIKDSFDGNAEILKKIGLVK